MSEAQLVALLSSAGLAIAGGLRWALLLWATVRREAIEAQKLAASQASQDHQRMVQALIDQARSMAELGARIDGLAIKLETLVDWRERTPVPAEEPGVRRGTNPHGYRPPTRGGHND